MRRSLAMFTLLLGAMAWMPTAPALAKTPSPAHMRAAVKKAESSTSVWATVNICNSRHYRNDLGIRGQMPALGFATWLSMDVQLYYYSAPDKRYVSVASRGNELVRLGRSSSGLQQGGALFQFSPHQPTLKAIITFFWHRSGQLLGKTQRSTTAGHRNADFGSPPHHSAATCTIV